MATSTDAPLSEGAVVSSPFFFDLQPQKRNIIAHMMSATAEISFLFIVFSFLFLTFLFSFPEKTSRNNSVKSISN